MASNTSKENKMGVMTTIGENVHLENQVVDKYVKICHENNICAPEGEVGYIKYMDTL